MSEPTVADWWMVWITAVSVLVSGVLAWLAYWNGRRATQIAEASSVRDEEYREREMQKRHREERSRVALSMMRALVAAERFTRATNAVGLSEGLEGERDRQVTEALAQIDVYAVSESDDELHVWFESVIEAIDDFTYRRNSLGELMNLGEQARLGIVLWNEGAVTSNQLAVGDLPRRTAFEPEAGPQSTI